MKRFILDLSIGKLYIASFMLLISISVCWWYFFYSPLLMGIEQNDTEIQLLNAQLARCRLIDQQCEELQKKYDNAKNTCNTLIKKSQMNDAQKAAQSILYCAENAHLSLISYEMQQVKDVDKFVASYILQGPYEKIVYFVADLEKTGAIHHIISCKLMQANESLIRCILQYECSKMDLIL